MDRLVFSQCPTIIVRTVTENHLGQVQTICLLPVLPQSTRYYREFRLLTVYCRIRSHCILDIRVCNYLRTIQRHIWLVR